MPNYQNGKIYKLVCDETNLTYIGSTTQSLSKRLCEHNYDLKKNRLKTISNMIEPKIYLVEDYPCERKEQLNMRERHFIENMECINKNKPCRTIKEHYLDNKEKICKRTKEHYKNNKEKHNELTRKNYEKNKDKVLERQNQKITCECGEIIRRGYKSKHIKTKKHLSFFN